MAALSNSRRAASGIALIIAGVIFMLAALLPLVNVTFPFIDLAVLGALALAVALAILGMGAVNSVVTKVALFVAAVGWAIIALLGLNVITIDGTLITIIALITAVAGVVAAVVLYTGKEIRNRPAIAFIVAMSIAALYLLDHAGLLKLDSLSAIVALLFGIALVVAGWLFRQKERGRR
jgi:hypothetical protein